MPQPIFDEPKAITMNFFDALKEVTTETVITRIEWENANIYGFLKDELLCIHMADGKDHHWIISDGDMIAEDWISYKLEEVAGINKVTPN